MNEKDKPKAINKFEVDVGSILVVTIIPLIQRLNDLNLEAVQHPQSIDVSLIPGNQTTCRSNTHTLLRGH